MKQQEQARIQVLNTVLDYQLPIAQAAEIMGVSERHTKRLLAAYRKEGPAALAHGNRGRRPHNAVPEAAAAAVVKLASKGHAGTNHSHFTELLREREGIDLSLPTVRRILVKAGLGSPRSRRSQQHRFRRKRMPQEGMLIQVDGSPHAWLEERAEKFVLLLAVDDATGVVAQAVFHHTEDTRGYMVLLEGLVRQWGIPLALYSGRHAAFKYNALQGTVLYESTQFATVMRELGIQQIFATSPQAKGRVERMASTFQDRLVTKLRLAGATNMEEANAVLQEFLPRFNQRFAVAGEQPETAYRPVPEDLSLTETISIKHTRKVARDNTVKYHWRVLQLLPGAERPSYAGSQVVILHGLDGRLSVQHDGGIIADQEAPPSPGALRKAEGTLPAVPVPAPDTGLPPPASARSLQLLNSQAAPDDDHTVWLDDAATGELEVVPSPGKPTFLQGERWKAVQQAKLRGLSIRGMARELGIHRNTVRKYIDAESPPTRRSPIASTEAASDTISKPAGDISPEQLNGHSP